MGTHRLVFHLGSGGEAEVWAAVPSGPLKRVVAVKVLTPTDDPELEAAFLDEARAVALLDHPAIVPVLDVGTSAHGLFMVMELVKGPTLAMVLRREAKLRRGLQAAAVGWIGERLGSALDHAWITPGPGGQPLRIVHRDVSPQNVLVDQWGSVRLADFGAARSTVQRHRSVVGLVIGKPSYMAPEQATGRRVDDRTDIHAVGIVMYECATARRLFDPNDPRGIAVTLATQRPRLLTEIIPDFPASLAAIIARCLEKDPDARWPSASALVDELRRTAPEWGGLERAREQLARRVNEEFPPHTFEIDVPESPRDEAPVRPRSGVWPAAPGVQTDPQLPPGPVTSPLTSPQAPARARLSIWTSVAILVSALLLLARALWPNGQGGVAPREPPPAATPDPIAARPGLAGTTSAAPSRPVSPSAEAVATPPARIRAPTRRARVEASRAAPPAAEPFTPSKAVRRIERIAAIDPARGRGLLLELNELDLADPAAVSRFERRLETVETSVRAGKPPQHP